MDKKGSSEEMEVRKGPWTMEEDFILINYITTHGEGVWNALAKAAGLKRTGKSCRLRWLNYLRPDVRRGNITSEEQLLIMDLHAKWGNKWSKIAKHLPGRTDNEIKNYWRTRIQKHIKQPPSFHNPRTNTNNSHMISAISDQLNEPINAISDQLTEPEASSSSYRVYPSEPYSPSFIEPSDHFPIPFPAPNATINDAYWGVEDLWSMQQLLNH